MAKIDRRTTFPSCAFRNDIVEAGAGTEQQFLDAGAAGVLHATPFLDGNKDGGLHSTARHDLRPVFERRVQKFAETRFRVLQLPGTIEMHPAKTLYD